MSFRARALAALCMAQATMLLAGPLRAQQSQSASLPDKVASAQPAEARFTARPADLTRRSALDTEPYVLAYRRTARLACRLGAPRALDSSLGDARATLSALAADDRAAVQSALDSAYAALDREGGCDTLMQPIKVVMIDAFHGHPWNTPLAKISKRSDGTLTEDGFLLVKRSGKVRGIKGEATFIFTALEGRERLASGAFRVPVTAESCEERWRALEADVLTRHASLRVTRSPFDPGMLCASAPSTIFRNPDTNVLEASMRLRQGAGGAAFIEVDYPGLPGFTSR